MSSFVSSGVAHAPHNLAQRIRDFTDERAQFRRAIAQHDMEMDMAKTNAAELRLAARRDKERIAALEAQLRTANLFLEQRRWLKTAQYLKTEYALKYLVENWPQVFVDGVVARIADYVWGPGYRAWEEHDLELRIRAEESVEEDHKVHPIFFEEMWVTGHFEEDHSEDEMQDESRILLLDRVSLRPIGSIIGKK